MAGGNDPILGRSQNLPYDLQTQQLDLETKRKLMLAMLQQAMGGSGTAKPGDLSGIGDAITGYMAKKNLEKISGQQQQVGAQYQGMKNKALADYMQTKLGTPAVSEVTAPSGAQSGMDATDNGVLQKNPIGTDTIQSAVPAQRGDIRKAILAAMQSGIPEVQSLGEKDAEKQMLTAEQRVKGLQDAGSNYSTMVAALNDPTQVPSDASPKHDIRVDDNVATDLTSMVQSGQPPQPGTYIGQHFNAPQMPEPGTGLPMMQASQESGRAHGILGTPTNETENELAKLLGKDTADQLSSTRDALWKAQAGLPTVTQLPQLIGGAFTGSFANQQLAWAKIGKMLGFNTDDPRIANSESLRVAVSQRILDNTRALGTGNGFSDNDLRFLKDAMAADLAKDPTAMTRVAGLAVAGTLNLMRKQELLQSSVQNNPQLSPATKANVKMLYVPMQTGPIPPELQVYQDPHSGLFTVPLAGQGMHPDSWEAGIFKEHGWPTGGAQAQPAVQGGGIPQPAAGPQTPGYFNGKSLSQLNRDEWNQYLQLKRQGATGVIQQ